MECNACTYNATAASQSHGFKDANIYVYAELCAYTHAPTHTHTHTLCVYMCNIYITYKYIYMYILHTMAIKVVFAEHFATGITTLFEAGLVDTVWTQEAKVLCEAQQC